MEKAHEMAKQSVYTQPWQYASNPVSPWYKSSHTQCSLMYGIRCIQYCSPSTSSSSCHCGCGLTTYRRKMKGVGCAPRSTCKLPTTKYNNPFQTAGMLIGHLDCSQNITYSICKIETCPPGRQMENH